jgi:hypothetical protein
VDEGREHGDRLKNGTRKIKERNTLFSKDVGKKKKMGDA